MEGYVKGPDNSLNDTLKRMIDTWQTPLLRFCYLQLHDRHLAEDAVQETFLKAARTLHTFRGECSEKNWLLHIALNTCRDMLRGKWFRFVNRSITPDMLPEPAAPVNEEAKALTLAVMMLPDKLRIVITLYYYHNLSMQEIADLLGISQPSVSNRLKRARAKLHAALEGGSTNEARP